jgi:hypothetical protein
MPCVAPLVARSFSASPDTLLDADELLPTEPTESIPLYLPSSLPQRLRQLPELADVLEKECRLRVAQAEDALAAIRHQRRIISGLWHFKKLNIDGTGNRASTRMRTLYNRFDLRTRRFAECYRMARSALLVLNPDGSWQSRLKDLRDNDIRGPGKDDSGSGNSRFEPSWIWLVPRVSSIPDMGDSEHILNNSLQVEWAKVQARKQRWEEEVLLIQEEMRRVVMFHKWKAEWWRSQAGRRSDAGGSVVHGVTAYAEKQAHLCECLAQSCVAAWLPTLKGNGAASDWETHYSSMPATADTCRVSLTDDEGSEGSNDGRNEGEECEEADDLYMDTFELDD